MRERDGVLVWSWWRTRILGNSRLWKEVDVLILRDVGTSIHMVAWRGWWLRVGCAGIRHREQCHPTMPTFLFLATVDVSKLRVVYVENLIQVRAGLGLPRHQPVMLPRCVVRGTVRLHPVRFQAHVHGRRQVAISVPEQRVFSTRAGKERSMPSVTDVATSVVRSVGYLAITEHTAFRVPTPGACEHATQHVVWWNRTVTNPTKWTLHHLEGAIEPGVSVPVDLGSSRQVIITGLTTHQRPASSLWLSVDRIANDGVEFGIGVLVVHSQESGIRRHEQGLLASLFLACHTNTVVPDRELGPQPPSPVIDGLLQFLALEPFIVLVLGIAYRSELEILGIGAPSTWNAGPSWWSCISGNRRHRKRRESPGGNLPLTGAVFLAFRFPQKASRDVADIVVVLVDVVAQLVDAVGLIPGVHTHTQQGRTHIQHNVGVERLPFVLSTYRTGVLQRKDARSLWLSRVANVHAKVPAVVGNPRPESRSSHRRWPVPSVRQYPEGC